MLGSAPACISAIHSCPYPQLYTTASPILVLCPRFRLQQAHKIPRLACRPSPCLWLVSVVPLVWRADVSTTILHIQVYVCSPVQQNDSPPDSSLIPEVYKCTQPVVALVSWTVSISTQSCVIVCHCTIHTGALPVLPFKTIT